MNARIDSIRQQVDGIRKSGKMPHWRMVYADALLTRAQEYMAIDRAPEALRVLDKAIHGCYFPDPVDAPLFAPDGSPLRVRGRAGPFWRWPAPA